MHPYFLEHTSLERVDERREDAALVRRSRIARRAKAPLKAAAGHIGGGANVSSRANRTLKAGGLRARIGLHRLPWTTIVVLGTTTAMALSQFVVPSLLRDLERLPTGMHRQWWRTGSALFVQDGGVAGAVSNLIFLAVIGALAEQVLSVPRWLAQYLGVGLLAELIGYAWQPVGGGNSIAICGLAGAVALASWRTNERLPSYTSAALLIWCAALFATLSPGLLVPAIVVGAAAAGVALRHQGRHQVVLRLAALAVVITAVVLAAVSNIHGAALLIGISLALLVDLSARTLLPRIAEAA